MYPDKTNLEINQLGDKEESKIRIEALIKKKRNQKNVYAFIWFIFSLTVIYHFIGLYTLSTWIVVTLSIFAILFFIAFIGIDSTVEESELKILEYKIKMMKELVGIEKENTHFDSLVKINIENLAEYYQLVKIHTNKSFTSTLWLGITGFILILAGIIISFYNDKLMITYLSTASGILIEFISAIFFFLYNKTVRQLKEYHDSLLQVQNILLSFKLIESTESAPEKFKLVEKMIDSLAINKLN